MNKELIKYVSFFEQCRNCSARGITRDKGLIMQTCRIAFIEEKGGKPPSIHQVYEAEIVMDDIPDNCPNGYRPTTNISIKKSDRIPVQQIDTDNPS